MSVDFLPGCGCLPRVSAPRSGAFPVWEGDDWVIPEAEWTNTDLSYGVHWILDQNPFGWCTWFSSAQAVMVCQILDGQPPELLLPDAGPVSLGTGDSGYPIDWALEKFILPVGFPPIGAIQSGDIDPTKYGKRLQKIGQLYGNWRDMAACRRGLAARDCLTYQAIGSALEHGWPCVGGIDWQDNPRGGHALCIVAKTKYADVWHWEGPNSWGGLNGWMDHPTRKGWFSIPAEKWDLTKYGGFAICDSAWSPEDHPVPEVA